MYKWEAEVIRRERTFGSKLHRIQYVISRDLKRWSGAFFLYMRYAERRLSERGVACAHTFVRARSHDGRATGAPQEHRGATVRVPTEGLAAAPIQLNRSKEGIFCKRDGQGTHGLPPPQPCAHTFVRARSRDGSCTRLTPASRQLHTGARRERDVLWRRRDGRRPTQWLCRQTTQSVALPSSAQSNGKVEDRRRVLARLALDP